MQSIHFVCRGNRFRSRIAEALFNSLDVENILASSSGIEPTTEELISPWARMVLEENFIPFEINAPRLTTEELLDKSDFIVVLSQDVYFDYPYLSTCNPLVWNVVDIDKRSKDSLNNLQSVELKKAARDVFNEINFNIANLLGNLTTNT